MMTGWLALSVVNTFAILLLMRHVHRLIGLQRDHQDLTRGDSHHIEQMMSLETQNRRREIQEVRNLVLESRVQHIASGDRILSELLKDVEDEPPKENPQERPLTSFERVLQDDPEDPV